MLPFDELEFDEGRNMTLVAVIFVVIAGEPESNTSETTW